MRVPMQIRVVAIAEQNEKNNPIASISVNQIDLIQYLEICYEAGARIRIAFAPEYKGVKAIGEINHSIPSETKRIDDSINAYSFDSTVLDSSKNSRADSLTLRFNTESGLYPVTFNTTTQGISNSPKLLVTYYNPENCKEHLSLSLSQLFCTN